MLILVLAVDNDTARVVRKILVNVPKHIQDPCEWALNTVDNLNTKETEAGEPLWTGRVTVSASPIEWLSHTFPLACI